jgi:hypothetical protein
MAKFEKGNTASVGNQGGRPKIYDEKYVEELIGKLNEWVQLEDSISILGFCSDHYLSYQRVSDLSAKYPEFSEAFSAAKMKLGMRRERNGLLGKFDSAIVRQTQISYDPFLKETVKELKKADNGMQPITLNKVLPYDDSAK